MDAMLLTGALSDRDRWSAGDCSMAAAFDVVGRRASMLILREAYYGAHRFDEFARRAGLTEAITATRLKELVAQGLLERRPYHVPGQRRREEYHLTPKGTELIPALVALMRWGDRWIRDDGGRVQLTHTTCGAQINVELRCENDHVVAAGEIAAGLRPADS